MERFIVVDYLSDLHKDTITLRNKVLREPLGLVFSEDDLKGEENAIHLAYLTEGKEGKEVLAGACFLTPYKDDTIRLRQMAVDPQYHKQGIGRKLITFAEKTAKEKGYKYIYLHAREVALDFYKKQNYTLESDVFYEVGIPHYEMIKEL